MNNIIETDKLSVEYDKFGKEYKVTIFDTHGHYIDDTLLSREDIKLLYEGLDAIKDKFLKE